MVWSDLTVKLHCAWFDLIDLIKYALLTRFVEVSSVIRFKLIEIKVN